MTTVKPFLILLAMLVCSTATAQESVTFCLPGRVGPDPFGIGSGYFDFTASITIGPADAVDVNYFVDRAEFRSHAAQLSIDGVVLGQGDFDSSLTFWDRTPSEQVDSDLVMLAIWFEDPAGEQHLLRLTAKVPLNTFVHTQNYEPFVPIPTTGTVGGSNGSVSGLTLNWNVLEGTSLVVSSYGCDPPTVIELIDSLVEITGQINLDNGLANSLDAKLGNILDAWVAENADARGDVLNKLEAFLNSVEAQRGKKIAEADADHLAMAAHDLEALILLDAE